MKSKKIFDVLFSSGLAIAIVTFMGYFFSTAYYMGYYDYFEIPYYFIEVSVTNIITGTIYIALILLTLSLIINGVMSHIPYRKGSYFSPAINTSLVCLIILLIGYYGLSFP